MPGQTLWIRLHTPVERSRVGSADPVENLGSTSPTSDGRVWPGRRPLSRAARDRGFNRSSSSMSSASLVPVEKSGPDFHRLATPTCPKSAIRSFPKYGSVAVGLNVAYLSVLVSRGAAICTAAGLVAICWWLPGAHYNTGLWIPQGM